MGNVNLRALDAYDEQQTRHDSLKEELGRLKEQRKRLIKLVEELNEKKKIGFTKVFIAVNEKFKMVYAELSEGGEAELLLENPDDPFSAGMLINARPPGKKVHRLEALSGGEKGLVSMALIFAIQRHDPSPFYMLDEVDQNLDAINAENVAVMVKKNSERAQFLQISLRKVTLNQADHIVGVTMQKKGISDIIMKVDLGDVKESPIKAAGPAAGQGTG
jgi:chromosome segregation protein